MKKERRFSSISLPLPLIEKIKNKIKGTGFTSVSSYVEFVMRSIVGGKKEEKSAEEDFTKEDTDKVKESLRALGYI